MTQPHVRHGADRTSLTRKLVLVIAPLTLILLLLAAGLVLHMMNRFLGMESALTIDRHAQVLEIALEYELHETGEFLTSLARNESLWMALQRDDGSDPAALLQQYLADGGLGMLDYLLLQHQQGLIWLAIEQPVATLLDEYRVLLERAVTEPLAGWHRQGLGCEQAWVRSQPIHDPATGQRVATLMGVVGLTDNHKLLERLRQRVAIPAVGLFCQDELIARSSDRPELGRIFDAMQEHGGFIRHGNELVEHWHGELRPLHLFGQELPLAWAIIDRQRHDAGVMFLHAMVVLLAAVALTMLLVFLLVRHQVIRPLTVLSRTLGTMTGQHGKQVPLPWGHEKDEIGSLVDSFNHLVSEIGAGEQRYQRILNDAGVIAWEMDKDSNFTFISPYAEQLLGYPLADLHQAGFWHQHLHHADRQRSVQAIESAIHNGENLIFEYRMIKANGEVIWLRDITKQIERDNQTHCLRGVLVDITERKQAELALTEQLRIDGLVAVISQQFSEVSSGELDGQISTCLKHLGEFFQVDRSYLFLVDEDDEHLIHNTHEWCAEGIEPQIGMLQDLSVEAFAWSYRQLSENQVITIPEVAALPTEAAAEQAIFQQQGIRSLLMVPLLEERQLMGFIGFDSVHQQRHWSERELGVMRIMTRIISAAIHRTRIELHLRQETTLLGSLLDSIPDMVFFKDSDGHYLGCNPEFARFVGRPREAIVGKRADELFEAETAEHFRLHDQQTMQQSQPRQDEEWVRYPDGARRLLDIHKAPLRTPDGEVLGLLGVGRDITEQRQAEDQIHALAFYDPLTNLPNRRLLLDRLGQALATSHRSARCGALLFIDLDDFKTLNDTLGHDVGDLLLVEVGNRLVHSVRESDTVARFGGDEFVVMLEDLDEDPQRAGLEAESVANKLLEALNRRYRLNNHFYHSSPSIGVTLFMGEQKSVEELLKHADMAMYRAKAAGRNTIRFFEPGMQEQLERRAAMEADLRLAIRHGQFLLYYQPQYHHDGHVIGAEALVRWLHPVRGMVSPLEFIQLAEETGLIQPLGHWILETACARLLRWQQYYSAASLTLAVNISAQQFRHDHFVEQVQAVVCQSGIEPGGLKLEITESMMVDNVEDTIRKMGELKRLGVGFAIDDFGTGYSSLAYLKRLPLDQLKIDQSFVRDIVHDPNDAAIVQAIIAMAGSLGIATIAEGVEDEQQRRFLAESGCVHYQGYLFGRPLPASEFEALLPG